MKKKQLRVLRFEPKEPPLNFVRSPDDVCSVIARKANTLQRLNPASAASVETLIDELLEQFSDGEGRAQ